MSEAALDVELVEDEWISFLNGRRVEKALRPFRAFVPVKPLMAGYTEAFSVEELQDWITEHLPLAIEPKWNGFRVIVEREGERMRMWSEGKPRDNLLPRLPALEQALRDALPAEDYILDADLGIERSGRRLPRPELQRFNAQRVEFADNERPVLTVFDVPYWREDLSALPLRERRERMEQLFRGVRPPLLHLSPQRIARTMDEVRRAVQWAFEQDRSEGAMLKELDSPYETEATDRWAKLKRVAELKVIVLDKKPVKGGGAWNYRGGLALSVGDEWQNRRTLQGKEYVDLGWSFSTSVRAEPGDIITVHVLELIPDAERRRLSWLGARVQDRDPTRSTPYTTAQALDIARRAEVLQKAAASPLAEALQQWQEAERLHMQHLEEPASATPEDQQRMLDLMVEAWKQVPSTQRAAWEAMTAAIELHRAHIRGEEPVSEESQQRLMRLMEAAEAALEAAVLEKGEWREEDHPRDDQGRFTDKPDWMERDETAVDHQKSRSYPQATLLILGSPVPKSEADLVKVVNLRTGDLGFYLGEKAQRESQSKADPDLDHRRVPPSGPRTARLAIVGDGPGEEEARQGKPWVGRSGQFLRELLQELGVDGERDVWWANVYETRAEKLEGEALQARGKALWQRLRTLPELRAVLALSSTAAEALAGVRGPMEEVRGEQPPASPSDPVLIVSYHPSALLRTGQRESRYWPEFREDVQRAVRAAGLLRKQEQADEEGGTRGAAAAQFWRDNWHRMWPASGRGRFVYHHHWRGLTEDEARKLSDEELMRTDHSVHGDLRLEANEEELWGWSIFLGTTADNRRAGGDRLVALRGEAALQVAPKLAQPHAWLQVGTRKPYVSEPGGVGATSQKWAKIFAYDQGTYTVGVRNRHFVEVFLEGERLRGRYVIQSVPVGGGRRVWNIKRPEDQRPLVETRTLEDYAEELTKRGHKLLLWAGPGVRPRLVKLPLRAEKRLVVRWGEAVKRWQEKGWRVVLRTPGADEEGKC